MIETSGTSRPRVSQYLYLIHTFVNGPFITLYTNYTIGVCHIFPVSIQTDTHPCAVGGRISLSLL